MQTKQQSPYFIFGLISTFITFGIFAYLSQQMNPILAYFGGVNLATFLLYGYDKKIAHTNKLRVPEWNLHALAMFGGSPAGLFSQKFFRHKTIKSSFQLIYWGIVLVQVGVVWGLKVF